MLIEGARILADEGKWLTNRETVGKVVTLGKNDKIENWHEITDEEYELMLSEGGETDG